MQALLDSRLLILAPGDQHDRLLQLATYSRRGRLAAGYARRVRFYTDGWKLNPPKDSVCLPRELLPVVLALYHPKVHDLRLTVDPVDFRWTGRLRPEQAQAAVRLYRQGGGVLVAPPAGGKTITALWLLAAWQQPALWIVHTRPLLDQAVARAQEVLALPRGGLGIVSGGGRDTWGTHLTVATVQSLSAQRWDQEEGIGAVVFDESHHLGALTYARVIHRLRARHRLGLTATAERTDGLHPLLFALMGSPVEIPLQLLVRLGRVVLPQVEVVATPFVGEEGANWNRIQELRAVDWRRNLLICALAAREFKAGRRVIVLVERVTHTQLLAAVLRERFKVPAAAVSGVSAAMTRQQAFGRLQDDTRQVLVATKVLDEGVDLPLADCLVQGAAQRSEPLLWQRIGRIMRSGTGKADAVVYDLADFDVESLADQARERLAVYQSLGFHVRRHGGVAA